MASSVFYKFKSQRDQSRVTFDGTGISVFDLKRDIILANNLGKANDFDLFVSDASSGQEFTDDSTIIPRSSSIIVRRLPASKPGRGKASHYTAGASGSAGASASDSHQRQQSGFNSTPSWHKGTMSKRFDGKEEPQKAAAPAPTIPIPSNAMTDDVEAAALAAMFQQQSANWEETQEKMTHATRIHYAPRGGAGFSRGAAPGKPAVSHQQMQPPQPDRPLPPSYVCYRCGQKGHWIQDCPTNNDREFDNRPRIKRTTGIPRSMLKTVENPNNTGQFGQGVMVTPEGGYVVAQPDLAAWQKQVAKPKALTATEVRERVPTDVSLVCEIDNKIFRDAVKTPCCGTTYCEECIQTHLLERDFVCMHCSKKIASLDKLIPDKETRIKVDEYIEQAIEESKLEGRDPEADTSADAAQSTAETPSTGEQQPQEFYTDQNGVDMSQMIVNSIPQLQAQIAQISVMLQNPSLPIQVRQTTAMQHQQLQMQLQQAQTISAALAGGMNMGMYGGSGGGYAGGAGQWGGGVAGYQQQQQAQGPYDRLPVNNRGKRPRPTDFGEEHEGKVARYTNWEQ